MTQNKRLILGGNMVRKLALAVSLALGSLPLSVQALGLGDIKTSSALNEKFKGEIELLSVKKGELDGLKVGLAPYSVFERNGVERPYVLSLLHFRPVRTKDGRAVIEVTSDRPIREPFLDFFLQLTWPNGQLIREYTVLLDPPVVTQRRAAPVSTPDGGATVTRTATPSHTAPAPRPSQPEVGPGGEYGPVKPNETLWQIAERLRPAGVSVHQMMMALYKANPQAFLRGNINLLKKGRMLHVPELDEIRAIGRREAIAQFRKASRTGKPVTPAAPATATTAQTAEPTTAEAAGGRLEIASAEQVAQEDAGASPNEAAALKKKLMLVEEQAESARQEAANLRARMDELEAQLAEMKRLLALKNATLAQLQAGEAGMPQPAEEPSVEETNQTPTPAPEAETKTESETTPTAEAPTALAPVESMEEQSIAAETTQPPVSEPTPAPQTEPPTAKTQPPPAPPADQPRTAPESTGGWQQWLSDNWALVASGGGVIALGLLGLGLARRRRQPETTTTFEQPPVVTPAPQPEVREPESILRDDQPEPTPNAPDSAMGDTSFLSEYSTEELRSLNEDTIEADPVSEADVYIAYGRYSQAEEILNEAMRNGNQSAAVRHKMLEVYYATQKKDEFRKLAEQMKEDGQDREDPQAWEHILAMGRDLDRNNPLFSAGAAAAGAGAAAVAAAATDDDSDLALDLSSLAEEVDSNLNPESRMADDFSTLDLELPSLQIGSNSEQKTGGGASLMDGETSDLEIDTEATELQTELNDLGDLADLGIESNLLDDSLANVASDLENAMSDSQILDEPLELDQEISSTLDEINASVSADELTGDDQQAEAGAEVEESESRLGDEVETKLELARAFMDIGDAEGARSILQEVQEDGTPEQKKEAAELLAQLDG